jgi:hypothetical protein
MFLGPYVDARDRIGRLEQRPLAHRRPSVARELVVESPAELRANDAELTLCLELAASLAHDARREDRTRAVTAVVAEK